jgi:hypothetical protein
MARTSLVLPEVLVPLDFRKAVLPRGTKIEHIARRGGWIDDLDGGWLIAAN